MKKLYISLMWITMLTIILDLLCYCLNWKVTSIVVSIVLIIEAFSVVLIYLFYARHKCRKCGTIFMGKKIEVFFAPHTPMARYMRCPVCNKKEWCDDFFETKEK